MTTPIPTAGDMAVDLATIHTIFIEAPSSLTREHLKAFGGAAMRRALRAEALLRELADAASAVHCGCLMEQPRPCDWCWSRTMSVVRAADAYLASRDPETSPKGG